MKHNTSNHIKRETALLFCLITLFIGFVGGVVFGAYKFRSTVAPSHNHPAAPAAHQHLEQAKAETLQHPESFPAWVHLGNLYFDTGQFKEAIRAYEKAVSLDPENPNVLTDLGVMHRRAGNPEKAVEAFENALAIDPKHEPARFNKGVVLLHDLNRQAEALKTWKELLELNPMAMAPNGISVDEMIRKFQSE